MHVLIVNWGTDSAKYPLSECSKLPGIKLYLATTDEITPPIRSIFTDQNLIFTNPYNARTLSESIGIYCQRNRVNFDVITTFFEMNVYETAVVADYFRCVKYLPPNVALRTSVNKFLMRYHLQLSNIVQPKYLVFDETEIIDAYEKYKSFTKATVIKPVHSGHSYGARFIDRNISFSKFKTLVRYAKGDLYKNYDEWMKYESKSHIPFLLEEFIPGPIYSFDGIVRNPHQIVFIGSAEFEISEPPVLQEIGHTVPIATLDEREIRECLEYVKVIISSLGLQYCGFHCELKYDKEPLLIEIAGRLPGGEVLESYQHTSRRNIFDLFFSIFQNRKIRKNFSYFLSESRKSIFGKKKFGKIIKRSTRDQRTTHMKYRILSRPNNELVYEKHFPAGMWLYNIIVWSKTLSAKDVKQERDKLISRYQIYVDSNIFILITLIAVILKRKVKSFLKFLFRIIPLP